MNQTYDALLVVSFGGPEGMDDVMPFLSNVLRGRNVPEARMREVKCPPLFVTQGNLQRIALTKFHQRGFACHSGLSGGLSNLFGAAFNAEHAHASHPRHRARQLPQPAAHIQDTFAALQLNEIT